MTHYALHRRISLRESFLEILRRRSVVIRPVNIFYIIFNVIIVYCINILEVKKKKKIDITNTTYFIYFISTYF